LRHRDALRRDRMDGVLAMITHKKPKPGARFKAIFGAVRKTKAYKEAAVKLAKPDLAERIYRRLFARRLDSYGEPFTLALLTPAADKYDVLAAIREEIAKEETKR